MFVSLFILFIRFQLSVRGVRFGRRDEENEGIERKEENLIIRNKSTVVARGKGKLGGGRKELRGINGDGRRLDSGC